MTIFSACQWQTSCGCLNLRNGIKNQFCEKKRGLNDMVKKFFVINNFEFEPLKVLPSKAREWVAQILSVSFVRDKHRFLRNFFLDSAIFSLLWVVCLFEASIIHLPTLWTCPLLNWRYEISSKRNGFLLLRTKCLCNQNVFIGQIKSHFYFKIVTDLIRLTVVLERTSP
jgi:hypothetical protein